jgi:hypothetical protein
MKHLQLYPHAPELFRGIIRSIGSSALPLLEDTVGVCFLVPPHVLILTVWLTACCTHITRVLVFLRSHAHTNLCRLVGECSLDTGATNRSPLANFARGALSVVSYDLP